MSNKKRTPKPPKAVYVHILDTTEGIPGNRAEVMFTTNRNNPFGKPGEDYSREYPWTWHRYVPEGDCNNAQEEA